MSSIKLLGMGIPKGSTRNSDLDHDKVALGFPCRILVQSTIMQNNLEIPFYQAYSGAGHNPITAENVALGEKTRTGPQ